MRLCTTLSFFCYSITIYYLVGNLSRRLYAETHYSKFFSHTILIWYDNFTSFCFLQELIKDQVANMYLWPKYLEVPIMDPSKSVLEILLAFNLSFESGFVNFILIIWSRIEKKAVGILTVKVLRATKLTRKDMFGKSDPYVKLKLTEDKLSAKKTKVKHSNLNPEWNEEFNLVVKDPESQALELLVYDWEQVFDLVINCVILKKYLKTV